jgi:transcriptional regulator with XRE-family HTH domain
MSDDAVLSELGTRLASLRLERNITQAGLARSAGISKRTLERLESGQVAVQLSAFLRVCRALDILERLDLVLPEAAPKPMDLLRLQGRRRQRARTTAAPDQPSQPWTWGDGRDR